MTKINVTFKVDEEIWKEVRKHCIDEKENISEYVEELIKQDLEKNAKHR